MELFYRSAINSTAQIIRVGRKLYRTMADLFCVKSDADESSVERERENLPPILPEPEGAISSFALLQYSSKKKKHLGEEGGYFWVTIGTH